MALSTLKKEKATEYALCTLRREGALETLKKNALDDFLPSLKSVAFLGLSFAVLLSSLGLWFDSCSLLGVSPRERKEHNARVKGGFRGHPALPQK